MKRAGKRDRKRKAVESGVGEVRPAEARPATGEKPKAKQVQPSTPPPTAASPQAPSVPEPVPAAPGPSVAAAPPSHRVDYGQLLRIGVPLAFLAVMVAMAALNPSAPTAQQKKPGFEPLPVIEDGSTLPVVEHPLEPWTRPVGPIPADPAPEPGDGRALLCEAVALAPKASLAVRRDLDRFAADPSTSVGEAARRWLRSAAPALDSLCRAGRAVRFEAPAAGEDPVDLRARHDLAVGALLWSSMHARGGGPALGAQRALEVAAVGQALARTAPAMEATAGAALGRLARAWLTRSVEKDGWSEPELAWLARRLEALHGRRGPRVAPATPASPGPEGPTLADGPVDLAEAAAVAAVGSEAQAHQALAARVAQARASAASRSADEAKAGTKGGTK